MADIINFTLPKIDGNTDTQTMKQIKNYLFQLTEQMKFYLNNIDTDNFTDEYQQKLSNMLTTSDTNATEISRTQALINQFNNDYKNEIQDSVQKITGNKGGYIVLRDSDNDTFPDELLVMDTSDYMTAQNIWRFNKMGLMHSNGGYDGFGTNIAITMDGRINADYISAGTLKGIRIEAAQGLIGGWNIVNYGLLKTNGENKLGIQAEAEDESDIFKTFFVDYGGQEKFYVKNDGKLYAIDATISGTINATHGEIAGFTLSENRMMSDDGNGKYSAEMRSYNFDQQHTFLQVNRIVGGKVTYPFVVQYDGTVYMKEGKLGELTLDSTGIWLANKVFINNSGSVAANHLYVMDNNNYMKLNIHYDGIDNLIEGYNGARDMLIKTPRNIYLLPKSGDVIIEPGDSIRLRRSVYLDFMSADNGDHLIYIDGKIGWTSSSRKYKKNIKDVDKKEIDYEALYNLPIRQFEFKDGIKGSGIDGVQIGFIADEVADVFPNAALRNKDGEPSNWTERTIIPAMLKLIQEQHTEIENLKRIVKGA